jgi:hypothetical protein
VKYWIIFFYTLCFSDSYRRRIWRFVPCTIIVMSANYKIHKQIHIHKLVLCSYMHLNKILFQSLHGLQVLKYKAAMKGKLFIDMWRNILWSASLHPPLPYTLPPNFQIPYVSFFLGRPLVFRHCPRCSNILDTWSHSLLIFSPLSLTVIAQPIQAL